MLDGTTDWYGIDDANRGGPASGPALERYDLLLAVIPLAFVTALVVGYALSVPPRVALAGASLVGAAFVADGLFRNPPRVGTG